MLKLMIFLFILCIVFPGLTALIANGLIGFVPVIEAYMPCVIVIVGLYILVKSVFSKGGK